MHLQDSQEAGGFREPKVVKQRESLDHWKKKYSFHALTRHLIWASGATKNEDRGYMIYK